MRSGSVSVLFKDPKLFDVEMGYYQYVSRQQIPDGMVGFHSENVCECVCGFITSDQGYAFFHFYRMGDANHLAELIQEDFENNSNVRIVLIGGNPNLLFLPWKATHRNIDVQTSKVSHIGALFTFKDDEGLNHIRAALVTRPHTVTRCIPKDHKRQKLDDIIAAAVKHQDTRNMITFDYKVLNATLRNAGLFVYGFEDEVEFQVYGIKDFVAYQNLASVLYALYNKTNLFDQSNIQHFNNPVGFNVIAKLNGKCGAYDSEHDKWDKYDFIFDSTNFPAVKIRSSQNFAQGESLDKENITSLKK